MWFTQVPATKQPELVSLWICPTICFQCHSLNISKKNFSLYWFSGWQENEFENLLILIWKHQFSNQFFQNTAVFLAILSHFLII